VGQVIWHSSVKSAARMNKAVVLFVEKVEQVKVLVETGITVNGGFKSLMLLTQPTSKMTLSNVPLVISDDFIIRELSRHGKFISPLRKVMSGCKSLLTHVVSHRRQLLMILNSKSEELRFIVLVDAFDYTLFATSSIMKCFGCGVKGHLIKTCPNRASPAPAPTGLAGATAARRPAPGARGQVPGAAGW